jgi:prefoldin alpha subunit
MAKKNNENHENEHDERELAVKFQMFEQQIRLIQEQLQAVNQAIIEMESLELGLDELIGKKEKEIISPIGRGIYVKSKLISEDMLIDIGNKNFITKSIPDTKKLLKDQIQKLGNVKAELEGELDKINQEITEIFLKHQHQENHEKGSSHPHNHKHPHKCKEGEECYCSEEGKCDCREDCKCDECMEED